MGHNHPNRIWKLIDDKMRQKMSVDIIVKIKLNDIGLTSQKKQNTLEHRAPSSNTATFMSTICINNEPAIELILQNISHFSLLRAEKKSICRDNNNLCFHVICFVMYFFVLILM